MIETWRNIPGYNGKYQVDREAARENYMSYQTIIDRCNGKCKSAFAPDGYAYAWEDSEVSMKHAIRNIET